MPSNVVVPCKCSPKTGQVQLHQSSAADKITFTTSLGSNLGVPLSSTYNNEIKERCQFVVPVLSGKQDIILYFSRKNIVRNCWPVTGSRKGLNV